MVGKPRRSKQGGYLLITDPDGGNRHLERDCYTCRHCSRIVTVEPFCSPTDIGRRCGSCDGLLCPRCSMQDACTHVEKRLETIERRDRLLRDMGVIIR